MTSTRIALFFSSLDAGGVGKVMLNLARGLAETGIAVDLVVVRAKGELGSQIPAGVNVVDLGASRTLYALQPLMRYLRQARPNVLLSAQTHNNVIALLARRAAAPRVRLVISEHNNMLEVARRGHWRDKLRPLVAKLFYRQADAIVAVSAGVADALARAASLPRERLVVIYNPVVTAEMETLAAQALDDPWFQPGQPPVILAVGRLVVQKDYPTLLRAFAIIHQQKLARLLILGDGELRKPLDGQIEALGLGPDVAMPGFVDNPYRFMARAGLLVLSSSSEGFANVLAEAMACGTPVVSTDCPSGPAEILDQGKLGRLVPVGDAEALADAILATLTSPLQGRVLKAAASRFSVQTITKHYLQVLLG